MSIPSADVVPENQLRMYIHFSAPMGLKGGLDYITLRRREGRRPSSIRFCRSTPSSGTTIARATRCSSIRAGRSAASCRTSRWAARSSPGKRYTLVVDREWRDGNGLPLKESFTARVPRRSGRRASARHHVVARRATRGGLARSARRDVPRSARSRPAAARDGRGQRTASRCRARSRSNQARRVWRFTPRQAWASRQLSARRARRCSKISPATASAARSRSITSIARIGRRSRSAPRSTFESPCASADCSSTRPPM